MRSRRRRRRKEGDDEIEHRHRRVTTTGSASSPWLSRLLSLTQEDQIDGYFSRLHGRARLRRREAGQRPRKGEEEASKKRESVFFFFCLPLSSLLTPSLFFKERKKATSINPSSSRSAEPNSLFSRQRLFFLFSFSPRDGQRRCAYVEKAFGDARVGAFRVGDFE